MSVQLCQKIAKLGQKFTKIDPKLYKIIQIWSKNYKKSQISQFFLPAQIISICTSAALQDKQREMIMKTTYIAETQNIMPRKILM